MKLNIFKIPTDDLADLRSRLAEAGAEIVHTSTQDDWAGELYFSKSPGPYIPDWIQLYSNVLPKHIDYSTRSFFAVYLFTKAALTYALSYGKAHFYLRSHCDYDFGIELAKRVANENDINQTATRRFQGRRKKDIRSFASNSFFDAESGESVDLVEARIIDSEHGRFGLVGRFGTSSLLVLDINHTQIGAVLTQVDQSLATEARFHIPRTTMITDDIEIARLDRALVTELRSDLGTTDFAHNSFDLYGVDFIFSSTSARFELRGPFRNKQPYESLTMRELKTYLDERNIPDSRVLSVKVAFEDADGSTRTQKLKNIIDYIADDDKVVLVSGKWMRFNQDYLDYLDAYVRGIDTEPVEAELLAITGGEPEFNTSPAVAAAGFHVADKDFDILRTTSSTSIEAWDLQRDNTVYAVKFGTAQKLGYVCDQALAVLEILRNQANVREIPHFERYCLWLGYRVAGDTPLQNISLSGSIILKQKIENWARKCRELGVTPVIRISRWIRPTPLTSSSPDPAAAGFTAAQH
jgi:uncharacterized protein (TIGR04141 family)